MHISDSTAALIFCVGGIWLASYVLAFVNPLVIVSLDTSARAKSAHFAFWTVYVVSELPFWFLDVRDGLRAWWAIPWFGSQILAISHFLVLLWTRRRIRLSKK